MKIYKYTANNGDWNGFHTHFIVAESKEEINFGVMQIVNGLMTKSGLNC